MTRTHSTLLDYFLSIFEYLYDINQFSHYTYTSNYQNEKIYIKEGNHNDWNYL